MTSSFIFASVFPPDTTSAGIRCGKLARATAGAGIRVRFIHPAERERHYEWGDGVHCTTFAAPIAQRLLNRSSAHAAGQSMRSEITALATRPVRHLVRALLQPDEFILESRRFSNAIERAIHESREEGFTPIVLACAPPWSTTIAARRASRSANAPLVVDFQDLWSENPVARWPHVSRLIAKRLERLTFAESAGFVFINERIAERYRAAHPAVAAKPFAVAHIGSDHPPRHTMRTGGGSMLELLHIGSIYGDRDLAPLLDACVALRRRGQHARLTWFGGILGDHPLRASLEDYRQAGVLDLRAGIPHAEARQRMREADLLVAVPSPSYAEELTGKLFDYLDAGRPVLALARSDSFIAEVLREGGFGSTLDPSDRPGIEAFLIDVIRNGATYVPVSQVLERFTPQSMGVAMTTLAKALG